jgi:hypothetical protein
MSSFSFTSLYIQFWIGDFTVGLCATSRVTVRCTWSHLRLNFSLTLYISAGLHAGQVCGTACRTLFFFILFATLAHDSIDTPAHSLVDLAPKHTQAFFP